MTARRQTRGGPVDGAAPAAGGGPAVLYPPSFQWDRTGAGASALKRGNLLQTIIDVAALIFIALFILVSGLAVFAAFVILFCFRT